MSRRRRGFFGQILYSIENFGREALSWFLWPIFVVRDFVQSLFGGGDDSIRRNRTWSQALVEYLLIIPNLVGAVLAWSYHSILLWPRMIRLRDLASGLPALLAAVAAVLILFFLGKEETRLVQVYESGSNNAYSESRKQTDHEKRVESLKLAQFYSRALVKLKPDDPNYRFNVGYIYQDLGEYPRAQSIMDALAPRYRDGFAKAHLWQADQLLSPDRPLTPEVLDAAEAHLIRALATYSEQEEIHRRLGELYYFRYVRYNVRTIDPRIPSREVYLTKAEHHLSQVLTVDPKLALTLAEIRALQGKTQQAELEVRKVITDLTARLTSVPDDLETRLRLAQAYRMVRQFADAANVLREGQNLRPDVRYDQELSGVYYFQSLDIRQRAPNALAEQFAALRAAYLAFPTNNYVAHRFVQALTSTTPQEAEYARNTLQALFDMRAPGQMAGFLLGFDCRRRTLPQKASDFFRAVSASTPDATPEVMAGLSTAVLSGQVKSVPPAIAQLLFETSLQVWPDHPDLLMVRAQDRLMVKDYSKALDDLKKALVRRPRDVKLHEMLALTYQHLGQVDLAKSHRDKANAVRVNAVPQGL